MRVRAMQPCKLCVSTDRQQQACRLAAHSKVTQRLCLTRSAGLSAAGLIVMILNLKVSAV